MSEVTDADRERAFTVADALSEVIDDMSGIYPAGVEIIAAALAQEREKARAEVLAERGTCGHTLPAHTLVADTRLAVCELPPDHNGWHQMTDDPAYPPVRWITTEADA